ncbi:28S ribosomal protein S2 [Blattella germanica]|nr:28S ribosomal protein S2 [Blattella germanica]
MERKPRQMKEIRAEGKRGRGRESGQSKGQVLRHKCQNITMFSRFSTKPQPQTVVENSQQLVDKDPVVDPLQHPDFFKVHELFTVQDLFEAKVHFGHKEGSLDERMKPFIFGSRLGHLIIDLDITAYHLRQALNITAHIAARDGIIILLGRGARNSHLVEKTALECNEFAHTRRWAGGNFTNAEAQFGAITRLPDLCIFVNTLSDVLTQHTAVRDAAKMCIPTIGIVDTNCNPNLVTYPVPGNDDTPSSIELYCKLFKEAILRGKEYKMKKDLAAGI